MGIKVEEPAWCELTGNKDKDYIDGITHTVDPKNMDLAVVVIKRKEQKKAIKAHLDKGGIPSQFILEDTIFRSKGKMGVFGNLLKQMNAKTKLDLYRLKIPL